MSDIRKQLFKLQMNHIEKMLSPGLLAQQSVSEAEKCLEWLKAHTIEQAFCAEELHELAVNLILKSEFDDLMVEARAADVLLFLKADIHDTKVLSDLIQTDHVHEFISFLMSLTDARRLLIHQIVASPVYSELISGVLYTGIRGFFIEENFLSKVPGLSSLLKVGKWGVSKAVPNMEATIENTASAYIKNNINRIIQLSEKVIDHSLSAEQIQSSGFKLWEKISDTKISSLFSLIKASSLKSVFSLQAKIWNHLRLQPFCADLLREFCAAWFEQNKQVTLYDALKGLGLKDEIVLEMTEKIAFYVGRLSQKDNFLMARVQAHLERFYESAEVKILLSSREEVV